MGKNFYELLIGDTFHTGKSYGSGLQSKIQYYMVYRKISKSEGICIEQVGYGNTRQVGDKKQFSAQKTVYPVT